MADGAQDIYQAHLDLVSNALMSCDFDKALAAMALPMVIETIDIKINHDTPSSLTTALVDFRNYFEGMDAGNYFRLCQDAQFLDADKTMIEGKHQTYVLRGGNYLIEPFVTAMTLKKIDGRWLATRTRSLITNLAHSILSETQLREHALARGERKISND